jgi:26S proteasome regulatory subunit N6
VQAIQRLSDVYAHQKDAEALRNLLKELRPLFSVITKAKTAKIVRNVIETIAKVPNSIQLQVCSGFHCAQSL